MKTQYSEPKTHPLWETLMSELSDEIPENTCGVYIIHFSEELGNPEKICSDCDFPGKAAASHYVGSSSNILERFFRHLHGKIGHIKKENGKYKWADQGARILNACNHLGITYRIEKIILCPDVETARHLETKIKARHNHKRLCPICTGE
jgi:hypothetical protein